MQALTAEPSAAVLLARLDAYAAATVVESRLLLDSPDSFLLAQLSSPGVLQDWPLTGPDDRLGLALLAESMGDQPESMRELYDDHRRIFVGPELVLACPYESVYLNEEHLTFGSETLAVREWYHRYGLRAPAEGREPDDHIGLELGFVSHLCLRALDVAEDGDEESLSEHIGAIGEFVSEHLLLWADTCIDHVVAHAGTTFYQGVGHLTKGTLRGLERDFAG